MQRQGLGVALAASDQGGLEGQWGLQQWGGCISCTRGTLTDGGDGKAPVPVGRQGRPRSGPRGGLCGKGKAGHTA